MQAKTVKEFLQQAAASILRENLLAQVMAIYWDKLREGIQPNEGFPDIRRILDGLAPFVERHLDSRNLPELQKSVDLPLERPPLVNDLRIGSIRISSVRGIGPKKKDLHFGMDFRRISNGKDIIQNAVIIGSNGSGKSSLFSALEYIYTGAVGEATLRYVNPDPESYLRHFDNPGNYCELNTAGGETFSVARDHRVIDIAGLREMANPESSFLSEEDVYHYGRMDFETEDDDDFHNQIARLLGLSEFVDCITYLRLLKDKSGSGKLKERQAVTKNLNQQSHTATLIKQLSTEIDDTASQLRNLEQNQPPDITSKENELREYYATRTFPALPLIVSDLPAQLNKFLAQHARLEAIKSATLDTDLVQFLKQGLHRLRNSTDCPFCEASKKSIDQIRSQVQRRLTDAETYIREGDKLDSISGDVSEGLRVLLAHMRACQSSIEADNRKLSSIPDLIDLYEMQSRLHDRIVKSVTNESLEKIERLATSFSHDSYASEKMRKLIESELLDLVNAWIAVSEDIAAVERDGRERIQQLIRSESAWTGNLTRGADVQRLKMIIESKRRELLSREEESARLKKEETKLVNAQRAVEEIMIGASELYAVVEREVGLLFEERLAPLKDIVEASMKVFFEELDIRFEFHEIKDTRDPEIVAKRLTVHLIRKDTGELLSHKHYLNAARYRLFCGSLALAVALAVRKRSNINLPIVIDDEFFAADYENRNRSIEYIKAIILSNRKATPHLPLQLILLTHDELIYECALKALKSASVDIAEINEGQPENVHEYWKKDLLEQTTTARLFPFSDTDPSPTESLFGDAYWNLLYHFDTPEEKTAPALEGVER